MKANLKHLKRLLKFTKTAKLYLLLTAVFSLTGVILSLITPVLTGNAIDLIIGRGNVDMSGITGIAAAIVIIVVLTAVSNWLMTVFANKASFTASREIRLAAFASLQRAPLKYLDANPHGDILSRIVSDTDRISDGLLLGFSHIFTGVVTVIATIVIILTIDIGTAMIIIIVTPLSLFVANFIAKKSYESFKRQSELRGELTSYTQEMIINKKTVMAYNYEAKAEKDYAVINDNFKQAGIKALFYSALTNPCTRFVNNLVFLLVGVFGGLSAIGGTITVGALSALLNYSNQYSRPFNDISSVLTELQSAFASAERIFEVIDVFPEPGDSENEEITAVEGRVDFIDVDFSYTRETSLINGFNLSVSPGQKVAIVGPTGSGKTTLINLLMRFYDVRAGEILIDGKNIIDIKRQSLRKSFGMVLQDSYIKHGTVYENIAYGVPEAKAEEVIDAAKKAHAHGFIKRLPQGYNTLLYDNGSNLSEGQRQLICIARVMLAKPPMLILDEATSSIDTLTESKVQKAFLSMMEGKTSFIVAHRLSTIKEADCILVLKDGNIIEQGTHEELLVKGGFYFNLYNSQFAR